MTSKLPVCPKNFDPVGELSWARVCEKPSFIKEKHYRGRRAQGVKYERKGHQHFQSLYQEIYFASPWLHFQEVGKSPRYCQPDAILFLPRQLKFIILEFKYNHTDRAWWQVQRLYRPVLQKIFGAQWEICGVEVVKWYDMDTYFPVNVKLLPRIEHANELEFGVHIWKP